MAHKGNCEKCGQINQDNAFDRCMFCGAALPQHQQTSTEEKQALEAHHKLAEQTAPAKAKSKSKSHVISDGVHLIAGVLSISDFE